MWGKKHSWEEIKSRMLMWIAGKAYHHWLTVQDSLHLSLSSFHLWGISLINVQVNCLWRFALHSSFFFFLWWWWLEDDAFRSQRKASSWVDLLDLQSQFVQDPPDPELNGSGSIGEDFSGNQTPRTQGKTTNNQDAQKIGSQ